MPVEQRPHLVVRVGDEAVQRHRHLCDYCAHGPSPCCFIADATSPRRRAHRSPRLTRSCRLRRSSTRTPAPPPAPGRGAPAWRASGPHASSPSTRSGTGGRRSLSSRPPAISLRTSSSRGVSVAIARALTSGAADAGCANRSISLPVMLGASRTSPSRTWRTATIRCSGFTSFRRKVARARAQRSVDVSSKSNVVRINTFGPAPVGAEMAARRLDAVQAWHPDVDLRHLGPVATTRRHRFLAVGRLDHDLDVRLRLEDHAKPGPDQGLVICPHDRDGRRVHPAPSSGSQARTW